MKQKRLGIGHRMTGMSGSTWLKALGLATALFLVPTITLAKRIENPVAVFSGIDKITGRTTTFDVYIGETVQFGALQVTPRVCYTRDDEEAAKTTTFVEVDEITLDRKIRRLFTGWMFADFSGFERSRTSDLRCLARKLQNAVRCSATGWHSNTSMI